MAVEMTKEEAVEITLEDATARPPDPEVAERLAGELSASGAGSGVATQGYLPGAAPGPAREVGYSVAGFDPQIHRTNPDGSPRLTKDGNLWPKPGKRGTGPARGKRLRSRAVDPADAQSAPPDPAAPVDAIVEELDPADVAASAEFWTETTEGAGMIAAGGDPGKMTPERRTTFQRAYTRMVEAHPGAAVGWRAQLAGCIAGYARECAERAQQASVLGRLMARVRALLPGGAA